MAKCVLLRHGGGIEPPYPSTTHRKAHMGQHDSGYKLLFSYPYLVECLIRGFVPGPWIERLDFSSLEAVREAHPRDEIGVRYDDMIWRLRWQDSGSWIYVYLLLEFQSTDEPFMAVRVLDYDGGLYRQLARVLKLKRGDKLPLVLPVVLYRGEQTWTAPEEVFDLIASAPAEIEPYLPHLRYLLLDANAFPVNQLEGMRNPAACLLWLERSETLDTQPIEELSELLCKPEDAGLRRAFALWLTTTFLPSRLSGVTVHESEKLEEISPMIVENTMDWSAQWREEGRRKGRREGEAEGRRKGEAEGRRKGEAEGRRKGEAELLLRQLRRLYGPLTPAIERRVRGAKADQLLDWGERVVTSDALADVFGRDD